MPLDHLDNTLYLSVSGHDDLASPLLTGHPTECIHHDTHLVIPVVCDCRLLVVSVLPVGGGQGLEALDALLQGQEVEVRQVRLGHLGGLLL